MADSILRLKVDSTEYDSKLKQAGNGLTRYMDKCRDMGGTLEVVEKSTLDYVKGLGQMTTTSRTARGSLSEMIKTFTDLRWQYDKLTDDEKKSPFGTSLISSLNQLGTRINEQKKNLSDIGKQIGESYTNFHGLKIESADLNGVINGLGAQFGINSNLLNVVTTGTIGMTAAITGSVAAIGEAVKAWYEYNEELTKRDTDTRVITGVPDNGEVEHISDVSKALADTYNVDVRDALNAVNTLMQQFGLNSDTALKLVREGLQGMLEGDGPKLLQMIQQYAPAFRDAGISAEQLVAIIHNSEGGIFTDANMNAIVMGIKNIRLMTNATSEALAKVGIDGEEMSKKLNNGSMSVFEALKLVASKIQDTGSSSQAAGEVMQQVFGRQGVSAGTNLGKAIDTLNLNLEETKNQTGEVGERFSDLEQANERLNKAIRETFGTETLEIFVNKLKVGVKNAFADILELINKIDNWLGNRQKNNIRDNDFQGKVQDEFNRLADNAHLSQSDRLNVYNPTRRRLADQARRNVLNRMADNSRKEAQNQQLTIYRPNDKPSPSPRRSTTRNNRRGGTGRTTTTRTGTTRNTPRRNVVQETEEQSNNKKINNLTEEYVKASDERRAAIRNEIAALQDRNKQIQEAKDEAKGVSPNSVKVLSSDLSDLQQKQNLSTTADQWQQWQDKINGVQKKINEIKGIADDSLPGLNNQLQQLTQKQSMSKTNQEWNDWGKKIDEVKAKIAAMQAPDFSHFTTNNVSSFISNIQQQLGNADFGTPIYNSLTSQLKNATEFSNLLTEAIKQGLDPEQFAQTWKDLLAGNDLDNALQQMIDKINEARKNTNLAPISVDTSGNVSNDTTTSSFDTTFSQIKDGWSDIEGIGNGIQGITDALNENANAWQTITAVVNGFIQTFESISSVIKLVEGLTKATQGETAATAAQTAAKATNTATTTANTTANAANSATTAANTSLATANTTAKSGEAVANATASGAKLPFPANIAAIAAGVAAVVAALAAISSLKFANGGIVPGNNFSGDNIRANVNSGELILNQAQQGNLASQLSDTGNLQNLGLSCTLRGEDILISLNNHTRRTNRSEVVTSRIGIW